MTGEKIDRILASEDQLIPSSGFVASVMERIREESAAPPPIPFPWKRALPGLAVAVAGLGWGLAELTRQAMTAARLTPAATFTIPEPLRGSLESAGWVALALCLSFVSWALARRLSGESRLF